MKKTLVSILLISSVLSGFSQSRTGRPAGAVKGRASKVSGEVIGKIIEGHSGEPLEYANVTVHKALDSSLVTGGITARNGEIHLTGVPAGLFYVRVNFIGFEDVFVPNVRINKNGFFVDLGKIKLGAKSEVLDAFEMVAEKQGIEYNIDKKVINVDKFYTATSGTAVDVLENVPSVAVDAERNVTVRGSSGFTVLIDGRPTILDAADALEQYPSSAIEKIEIITNPSAKFDPEGTAGIINIITKKQKLSGMSGIANVNIGMFDTYGADALLQFKREKVSWYAGIDYNRRGMIGEQTTYSATSYTDTTRVVSGDGDFDRHRTNGTIRAGADFNLNNKNFLLIEGSAQISDRLRSTEFDYNESLNGLITDRYNSLNESSRKATNWSANADYAHKFKGEDRKLNVQLSWGHRQGDEYTLNRLLGVDDNAIRSGQRTTEVGPNVKVQTRVNYVHKVNDSVKFEIGYQGTYDYSSDEFGTQIFDVASNAYIQIDSVSRTSNFSRYIHAPYAIYSAKNKNFGYQLGVRTEFTNRVVNIVNTEVKYEINRVDLFPTLHLSYKLPKKNQIMGSYSRRIQRPRPWYLEPYITARDQWNYRGGNPNLAPEYIDAAEIGHQKRFKKFFISTEAYYRYTHGKVERIRQAYPAGGAGATLEIPENVGSDQALGVEFMFKTPIKKWWELNLMINVYDYNVQGEFTDVLTASVYNFDNSSTNYTLRLNQTFTVFNNIKIQFNGSYNSESVTAQGTTAGFLNFSSAIRTEIWEKRIALNLSGRNLFGTAIHQHTSSGPNFETSNKMVIAGPAVQFTVTYKLNNYKVNKARSKQSAGMED